VRTPPGRGLLDARPSSGSTFGDPKLLSAMIGFRSVNVLRTLGYDQTSWQELESQLRSLLARPAEPLESTEYGTK